MVDSRPFMPDWVSPPGETIAVILAERGLTPEDFARIARLSPGDVEQILDGEARLTVDLARVLADALGASSDFWIRREGRYRQDLERLREEAARAVSLNWLDEVPVKDMIGLGWLKAVGDPNAIALAALRFFGVSSVDSWRSIYRDALHPAAFRTSPTFQSQPGALAAWLRQGEIAASSIRCKRWNAEQFRGQLAVIRALTREKDPQVFLPALTQVCAACGVAVVALRAPAKCRASGAVRFLSPIRALLMLSFRYLSDDQFWFTFFHEAAHLILHPGKCFFLEGEGRITTEEEEAANTFAANTLISLEDHAEMLSLPMQAKPVIRFARKVGIAPGIVVGQLQHRRDRYIQLNNLKRRYQWGDE